jgi:hypothetical protein
MAAMGASTTVEPATMRPTSEPAAMEAATACDSTAYGAASDCYASPYAAAEPVTNSSVNYRASAGACTKARPACESASAVVSTATHPATAKVAARIEAVEPKIWVEPRAGSDEYAAGEPISSVVTVGGAGIRVIRIVTIGADWGTGHVCRAANSDSNHYSLSMCVRCAG